MSVLTCCLILVCKKNEFRPWILEPLHKPKLESDSDFTASIEPYPFITDNIQTNDPVSAINISLTSFNKSKIIFFNTYVFHYSVSLNSKYFQTNFLYHHQ